MAKRPSKRLSALVLACTVMAVMFVQRSIASAPVVNGLETGERLANVGMVVGRFEPEGDWHWLQCSGTLVGPDVFLTAGHCIALETAVVEFGVAFTPSIPIDQSSPFYAPVPAEVRVYRGDAYLHPDFNIDNLSVPEPDSFDLGIITLREVPKGLPSARVVPAGYFDRFNGEHQHAAIGQAGYGLTSFLPLIGLQPFDWGVRRTTTGHLLEVFPAKVTVAPAPGQICAGDSGGPAFPSSFDALDHPVRPYVNRVSAVASYTVLTETALPCETASILYRLDTPQARVFIGRFVRLDDRD